MSGFPTVNFGESEHGLFSSGEIQRLMRIEYERARRYGYPFTLMLIEVDRLEYLHDLYGYQSKEEILEAVVSLLRSITRVSDVLGCMQDDRVLAVFPHLRADAVAPLAGRMLRGCRELEFESDGRSLRATLSIGVSAPHDEDAPDFDRFVQTAREALEFAVESGGDRYVMRETASAMIGELRDELTREAELLRAPSRPEPPAERPRPRIPSIDELPKGPLKERIRRLFEALGEGSPELQSLEQEIVQLSEISLREVQEEASTVKVTSGKQIETLERRIEKLKGLLDQAEHELHVTARQKGVEQGVASIYRSVQGLSRDENDYVKKREVLTLIFEANVGLQKGRRSGP